ncbi:MAG: amidohydrolase [Chloroflexi bacterium]|nr:amidohydrolase [Chloroflexota bacterium]
MHPNLILLNAKIHTLDSSVGTASALAISGERVVAVGSDAEILALADSKAEKIDLKSRTVVPGLTDAHIHFEWYARLLKNVNAETPTLDGCLAQVATKAAATPKGGWIVGHGWNHNVWGGEFPTATDLDRAAPEHPVFLTAKSGHAGWTNSLALRLAGITAGTPDPPGGKIRRDKSGRPTGILLEEATSLVGRHIPEPTAEDVARDMKPAMENCWRAGLTGIHNFVMADETMRPFVAYQLLKERGELGLRVAMNIPVGLLDEAIALGLRTGFGDDWLRLGNVKIFADGALGPRTAAMIEPYEGEPDNKGMVVTDKEELYEHGSKAADHGLALAVHAIGDKANHDVLDVLESVPNPKSQIPNSKRLRHRIEHVQLLHAQDYQRLGKLGIIASMQPIHATSDMLMADKFWGKRSVGAYAWRTQLQAGAVLAFGSDAPVEPINPLYGVHAAVTRRRADGSPGPQGWYPEQRLTVEEAVRGFTWGAAYAAGMEDRLGTLAPGRLADLVVLDRDIFNCDPMGIREAEVVGTMVAGVWRFTAI